MPNEQSTLTERHLILATAGHVDHGKTALVKALTGTDTDRLPEEKARGLTIDLGFAHLRLSSNISLGLIDVPGHEDFVRNMIAGVGSIDLALLVVAADDGWMPQTEEHVQILNYLNVRHGVVAITKCDLGDGERAAAEVHEHLRGTSLADAPIVITSVRGQTGLELLKKTLVEECSRTPYALDVGKPRLFVDRAFTISGAGTVVTGTLTGGLLARGETVSIQPHNLRARIRAVQSHNRPIETALPSTRTALNLSDVRVEDVPRGSVVTSLTGVESSRAIDVRLERSARLGEHARLLKNNATVHVHYGSGHFIARIALLERAELAPGEQAIARLFLRKPIFAFVGDRFILRDSSARQTLAGGLILDADAGQTRIDPTSQRFLSERSAAPNELPTLICTQLRRDNFARRAALLLKSSFAENEISAGLDRLGKKGEVFSSGALVVDPTWWRLLLQHAGAAIDVEHASHPERPGLPLTELRSALAIQDEELFNALINHLGRHGFKVERGLIGRSAHHRKLPPQLEAASAILRAAISAHPFDPPSRKQLATDAATHQALRFLAETGEIVLLNEEVVLAADAFAKMKSLILEALRDRGATTSELRQSLGTTRRVLVPLLERCDRDGLTIREGDRRRLRVANQVR